MHHKETETLTLLLEDVPFYSKAKNNKEQTILSPSLFTAEERTGNVNKAIWKTRISKENKTDGNTM